MNEAERYWDDTEGGASGSRSKEPGEGEEEHREFEPANIEPGVFPGEEPRELRRVPDVVGPDAKEGVKHELTHMPYRSWCKHCVQGRAREDKHRRRAALETDEIPLVATDYGFMGKNKEKVVVMLVVKDKGSKAMKAYEVKEKGSGAGRCEQGRIPS